MDMIALLRTLGGLGIVLGVLATALWIVRRYDIALPGRVAAGGARGRRRVELVERVQIDQRRSVVLLRRDDREHLFVLTPERATVLETRILRAEEEADAEDARIAMREMVLCPQLEGEWYAA